jgi:S-adenosylmethionine:tRNA ribosyltransferase-isomerase
MLTKDFAYILPTDRIARYPTPNRSDSRLLALDPVGGNITDHNFSDLINFIHAGDLLVINDTKVLQARMYGCKETGGKIEILIERILENNQAWVQIRASKTPRINSWLIFGNVRAQVRDFDRSRGMFLLAFKSETSLLDILTKHGEMPLPPYFNRAAEDSDLERYQTVYAEPLGSVAAPTAGLHFTSELLTVLQNKGVAIGRLTLHVGAGTFQPLRVQNIAEHKMHAERMYVSAELCKQIAETKIKGARVICVGTTTVRALESAALTGELQAQERDTDIFITPGFKFKVVDALITNFHLPESTLLMLVSAFAGKENVFRAYEYAIANNYRFYSYGDAMFITGKHNEI